LSFGRPLLCVVRLFCRLADALLLYQKPQAFELTVSLMLQASSLFAASALSFAAVAVVYAALLLLLHSLFLRVLLAPPCERRGEHATPQRQTPTHPPPPATTTSFHAPFLCDPPSEH
jgi:hypothetical protein